MHDCAFQEAYSYRSDPAVPAFDDRGPVAFMDGDCVLCTRGARLIARFDGANEIRICPIQTATGQAVLLHYGLDPADPESWLYLAHGNAYTSLDAMIQVGAQIGGAGRLLRAIKVLPRSLQDWLYRRIARNRYWIFGRTDMCAVRDADLQARLIR